MTAVKLRTTVVPRFALEPADLEDLDRFVRQHLPSLGLVDLNYQVDRLDGGLAEYGGNVQGVLEETNGRTQRIDTIHIRSESGENALALSLDRDFGVQLKLNSDNRSEALAFSHDLEAFCRDRIELGGRLSRAARWSLVVGILLLISSFYLWSDLSSQARSTAYERQRDSYRASQDSIRDELEELGSDDMTPEERLAMVEDAIAAAEAVDRSNASEILKFVFETQVLKELAERRDDLRASVESQDRRKELEDELDRLEAPDFPDQPLLLRLWWVWMIIGYGGGLLLTLSINRANRPGTSSFLIGTEATEREGRRGLRERIVWVVLVGLAVGIVASLIVTLAVD